MIDVYVPEVEGSNKGPHTRHTLTRTQADAAERCLNIVNATLEAERRMYAQPAISDKPEPSEPDAFDALFTKLRGR